MTDRELADLERAIDRAGRLGLEVEAHGRRKGDGARIYCVPSASEHNRWHVVVRFGSRLVCDCSAGQRGRICVHRAATYVYVFNEAQRRERPAAEVEQALREALLHDATRRLERVQRELDQHDRIAYSREAPHLADDCRPVGIFT